MSISKTEARAMTVEVVEFYPNLHFSLPKKLKEQGSCHVVVRIDGIEMEIKNIRYQIRQNGGVWVGLPINVYPDPDKKNRMMNVPTLTFKDEAIARKIKEEVEKELLAMS